MLDLGGRTAIVTGGSKGIGRAVGEALVDRGADVVLAARSEGRLRNTVEELRGRERGGVHGVPCDVRREEDCRRLVQETVDRFGRLDILINNAGVGIFGPVADLEPEGWRTVLQTNLDGVFYCTHYALPHLKRAGESWVINIGSLAGTNAFPGGAAYNASKFGLIGFSEALMQEVRHDGVRVSYIMPGSVNTEFGSHTGEDAWKIQPEDLADVVVDLLATPSRTLPSRVEVRPSRPPRK